jgi:adenine-specific DNA-methyltransferase
MPCSFSRNKSINRLATPKPISLTAKADFYRLDATRKLDPKTRGIKGQFMTPEVIATFMASLFSNAKGDVSLLDAGAGVGSLTAAFIDKVCSQTNKPNAIQVSTYEIEAVLVDYLEQTLKDACQSCHLESALCTYQIKTDDFISDSVNEIKASLGLFAQQEKQFSHCIINPPYKKISSQSAHRKLLRQVGIETSNLYSGFLSLAIMRLQAQGELVAIIPRSFCNGAYFKPFREFLLKEMALTHIHIFDSRNATFKEDAVLQETIIFHAIKGKKQGKVTITSSHNPDFSEMTQRLVPFEKVVSSSDPNQFIHIAVSEFDQAVIDKMHCFKHSLSDLGINVSTGPVVDFRLKTDIRQQPEANTYPLIYPIHFDKGQISWPKDNSKKPNAIFDTENTHRWLMINGWYTLTKRFSSKEEPRRITAALHNPEKVQGKYIGFENHINVFHANKKGLDANTTKGLAVYLNSTLIDLFFRQFSGHTQVNVTDLRILPYPDLDTLRRLGKQITTTLPEQSTLDSLLETEIQPMTSENQIDPLLVKEKTQQALVLLKALGLPKAQQNERSALTLLSLIDLKADQRWSEATNPLMGITPIMDYIKAHYGKPYAPNTRETIRRQTMHQFVDAGLAVPNSDDPSRPINSPKWVYQIEAQTLALIRTLETDQWDKNLTEYLKTRKTLIAQYAKKRKILRIPLTINGNKKLSLTPGIHSELIRDIIIEFGSRFAPASEVLYIGDTGEKLGYYDEKAFNKLGLCFDNHGKFPDVVLHFKEKNWLLLIESVTSHGPVDGKRHAELATLFKDSKAGLVYVTAFPNRKIMRKYLPDISWETEVWVADAATHLIHFNGERFLGPYQDE